MTRIVIALALAACISWQGIGHARYAANEQDSLLNLLPNTAFAADEAGHRGSPAGWQWEGPPEVAELVADRPFQSIGKSLRLDFRTIDRERNNWFCWSEYIPVDSAKSYQQSAWIKNEGRHEGFGASFGRTFYDADKAVIPTPQHRNFTALNVGATLWTHYSQTLVPQRDPKNEAYAEDEIPARAKYVRVCLLSYAYPRQVWFNDVRFEPYTPARAPLMYGHNKAASLAPLPADEKIKVDGRPDENVWMDAQDWETDFVRTVRPEDKIEPVDAAYQTRFKWAGDADNVYAFLQCHAPNPGQLQSIGAPHGDITVSTGDAVEIFLDVSGERRNSLQIVINPSGSFYERWMSRQLNLGMSVAAQKTAEGWQAEISIPRKALWQLFHEAGSNVHGGLWNVNVARHSPGAGEDQYSAWSYTGNAFANDEQLGWLLLKPPYEAVKEKLGETSEILAGLAKNILVVLAAQTPAIRTERNEAATLLGFHKSLVEAVAKAGDVSPADFFHALRLSGRTVPVFKGILANLQRLQIVLPKDRQSFGYVIYRAPLFERPVADQVPAAADFTRKVQLLLAQNERGQGTFSVFSKVDLKDVQINWTALKSARGDVIAKDQVDVRVLQTWGKDRQADVLATDLRIELQGWLSNYSSQARFVPAIASDSSRKFWVIVNTGDKSIGPGTYTGSISVSPANKPATTLPLEVTILPLTLPQTTRQVGFYYHGVLDRPGRPALGTSSYMFYNGLTTEETYLRELKRIRQAGFTMILLPNYADGPFDPGYTRKILTIAKQAGFENVSLMGIEHIFTAALAADPQKVGEARKLLKTRIEETYRVSREIGIKNLYIYGSDEPHSADDLERNRIICDVVHESGGKVAVAMIFHSSYNALEKLIDLPVMNWDSMAGESAAVQQYMEAQKKGKPILYYANLTADQTALSRLTFGWYLYKSRLGGNLPWAYYYLGLNWEPFTEEYPLHAAYYAIPTKDDPIPTLKFESATAGVTDLRYCELLERLIRECSDKAYAAHAQKQLDGLTEQVDLVNTRGLNSHNYLIPPGKLEENRNTVQQLITGLLQKRVSLKSSDKTLSIKEKTKNTVQKR